MYIKTDKQEIFFDSTFNNIKDAKGGILNVSENDLLQDKFAFTDIGEDRYYLIKIFDINKNRKYPPTLEEIEIVNNFISKNGFVTVTDEDYNLLMEKEFDFSFNQEVIASAEPEEIQPESLIINDDDDIWDMFT